MGSAGVSRCKLRSRRSSSRDVCRSAVLAAIAGVLFAGLLSALLMRPIALTVRQVADAARALATGNLEQTVTVNTQDELSARNDPHSFGNPATMSIARTPASSTVNPGDLGVFVMPCAKRRTVV